MSCRLFSYSSFRICDDKMSFRRYFFLKIPKLYSEFRESQSWQEEEQMNVAQPAESKFLHTIFCGYTLPFLFVISVTLYLLYFFLLLPSLLPSACSSLSTIYLPFSPSSPHLLISLVFSLPSSHVTTTLLLTFSCSAVLLNRHLYFYLPFFYSVFLISLSDFFSSISIISDQKNSSQALRITIRLGHTTLNDCLRQLFTRSVRRPNPPQISYLYNFCKLPRVTSARLVDKSSKMV